MVSRLDATGSGTFHYTLDHFLTAWIDLPPASLAPIRIFAYSMPMKVPSFLLLVFFLSSCGNGSDRTRPEHKPLLEAVYASGFVISRNEYQVFAQAEGYIVQTMADEGAEVKKGDVLFILESQQQNARYRLAKDAYDIALQNYTKGSPALGEIEAARENAEAKVKYDSANVVRYTNLMKQNATSKAAYDQMKLALENSQNELLLQRSRYNKIKNQLYLDLKNAETSLKIAGNESGRYSVRSEVDGRVYKRYKEDGELVRRNEAVALVGSKDSFYLRLSVDEVDIRKVKKGQEVLVKIDAFGDQAFHATVTKVHSLVDSREQSLRVDADFDQPLEHGFSGLAAEANIVIQRKEKALVIPKSLLLPGDSVLIQASDGTRKVKIKRGIETLDELEVIDGLTIDNVLLVKK